MRLLFAGVGGALGGFGARLVQPAALAPLVTFGRAQVSSLSTAFDAAGVLRTFAGNVPRFNGAARRLLIEGQRTNEFPEPIGTAAWSAIFGAPGTAPVLTPNYGLVAAPDGTFTAFRMEANAGASGNSGITRTTTTGAARSVWVRNLGGSAVTLQIGTTRTTSGDQATLSPGVLTRVERSDSTVAHRVLVLPTVAGNSTVADLLVWGPQSEPSAGFASSLILPTTPPAASTRGEDNLTAVYSTLFPAGVGTVLGSCMIPQNAPAGADQTLFEINDGTANNRIRLRNVAGGATIVAGVVAGGTPTDAASLGSMTAGTLFRFGLTWDGTTLTGNFNGGANQSVAAATPAGLATLRIGNNAARTAALFGEVEYLDALPYVIPPAGLPAAVAAIP